jgi:hypothetical protein
MTAETIIARAKALIPEIRAQADEAEKAGRHTAELDRKFVEAGFDRMLQPRLLGGYAFGMDTYWKVILAVAEGDAGTAWGLCLGAHHAQGLGAWFPEQGQIELFGPTGRFTCPHLTTKTPELESKDTLKRRIDEAATYVDLERLCISGRCGFASTVEGNALTIDEERAKLELLVETAREIWG